MSKFNDDIAGRLVTYFLQKLDAREHHTGWLRQGTCPACGKTKKFGINIIMDRTNCFSCGYHPKPIFLVMKLENLTTYIQVFKFLKAFEYTSYYQGEVELLETKPTYLPESFKLLSIGTSYTAKLARRYMEKRGFDILDLTMKGVGYCTSGKYKHRIIIPFYKKGKLVYFNAREFIQTGYKHLNPGVEEFGIGKSMLSYNSDCLYIYKTVALVESAMNALTIGDRAFTIGGKIISEYQYSDIIKSPCEGVVIILDPDAYWEALRTGLQLVNHKKVKVVNIPKIPSKKEKGKFLDINDLGRKKVVEYIKQTPWQSYKDIYRLFINEPKPIHNNIYE